MQHNPFYLDLKEYRLGQLILRILEVVRMYK